MTFGVEADNVSLVHGAEIFFIDEQTAILHLQAIAALNLVVNAVGVN